VLVESEQHLVLADDGGATELPQNRGCRVVRGEVEHVHSLNVRSARISGSGSPVYCCSCADERTQNSIAPVSVTKPRTSS